MYVDIVMIGEAAVMAFFVKVLAYKTENSHVSVVRHVM
jgi:hypothetical protein